MKKLLCCLLFLGLFLTSCSSPNSESVNKPENKKPSKDSSQNSSNTTKDKDTSSKDKDSNLNPTDSSDEKDTTKDKPVINEEDTTHTPPTSPSNNGLTQENIGAKVKDYILNGQVNKPEASKLKWSETFLNKVDFKTLYNQFISDSGDANDLEAFAIYITFNAPISSDWQTLFEQDLYNLYGEKVTSYEYLEADSYQVYVKKDNSEVPYVVVSSRTGYFHG